MEYTEGEVCTDDRIYPITFFDSGKIRAIPVPLARINTCGIIEVEVLKEVVSRDPPRGRYEIVSSHTLRGRGAIPALMLLKLLASGPHRFATNDWLSTQMRQEMEVGALVRLDTIASYLRGMLCRIKEEREAIIDTLRLQLVAYLRIGRGSGPGYQLAAYPLLWLDTDALSYHIEHATLMERMGEPDGALPFWERAYHLTSRGMYLADEPSSDWASEPRASVAGALRQSVQALYRLYLSRHGEAEKEEAIALLRTYWIAHKMDEDALRPLMELLGERERYQEAEAYYQECLTALDALESERQPDARTRDLREFLRIKLIQRKSAPANTGEAMTLPMAPSSIPINWFDVGRASFSHIAQRESGETIGKTKGENKPDMDPLRRATVAGLLSLLSGTSIPFEWWEHLAYSQPSCMKTDEFSYFQQLVENGWGLCNAGEWDIAERVLDSFLPDAIIHAPKQREAAILAAQGLVLRSILQAHQLKLTSMIPLCQQAVLYAKRTEDHTALCASLNGLAVAFKYNQRLEESFQTYLEALGYCDDQASALVRSRIYAGAAAAFARRGRKQEADLYINLAYAIFPDDPKQDAHFLSADHGWYMIAYYQGLMHLALNQPHEALKSFERHKERLSHTAVPQRNRLEMINHQGRAAILSHTLDIYASCLKEGIAGALELKSKKRLDEVVETFREDMPRAWRDDPQIKILIEQYPLLLQEAR